MDELSREALLFGSQKYVFPQFTMVPDGDHLLLGYSYGSRREFLARVPLPEVGAWLLANAEQLEASRKSVAVVYNPASGDDLLSELGLL